MAIESAGVLTSIQNTVLKRQPENVPRKIYSIGTYEAGKDITDEVPARSLNSRITGAIYGFGSMLHRLHIQAERGSRGIEFWNVPQAEVAGSAATGEIDFTGTSGVLAGKLYLYCGFDLVGDIIVTDGMTIEELADATVDAITENEDLNITAEKVPVTFEVTITSKTVGEWGNKNILSLNREPGQETPDGVVVTFVQPVGGTGIPDIQDALDGMGTGDVANENYATALIHGYGQDTSTLNKIRDYVGIGDELIGLYKKEVARPFYSITGDNVSGEGGLSALIAIGAARKNDRANSIFAVPGSKSHPSEIGAQVVGHIERIADIRPQESYTYTDLIRIDPGDMADRWTNDRSNRTIAIQNGISTSTAIAGFVRIMDTVTFYHPDTIPTTSNIYREITNICKIQNLLASLKSTYLTPLFSGAFIVSDVTKISSVIDRQKALDINIVQGVLFSLVDTWVEKGWIYEGDFAKNNLVVTLRTATDGFDSVIKVILSGINKINDNQIQADISTAVLS